jgi:hypothetical protein
MATAYMTKFLAAPAADVTTFGTLYSTDGTHTAVISSLIICNTSASNVLFRIGIMATAGTPAVASGQFVAYDATVAANDTITMDIGLTVGNTLFLRCSAASTAVNFIASVAEIS